MKAASDGFTANVGWLGLAWLGLVWLEVGHLSNEVDELSQWLCHYCCKIGNI